jgi:transcriptional regulator with XRE-family HTH domain
MIMEDQGREIKRILVGNIKKYRLKKKLTQERAAELGGITSKYWQRLEMSSQSDLPSLKVLFKAAKALGIPPSKLLN